MKIRIGCNLEDWKDGIVTELYWDPSVTPHLLLAGPTGAGKTVMAHIITNQLLSTDAYLAICDGKAGGDWVNIVPDYGEYMGCGTIFNRFYERFTETIENHSKSNSYLLFDEVSSYALSLDSAGFKDFQKKLGNLAYMGRSFNFHILLVGQTFSAKVIDTAIREQLGIKIYCGSSLSTEEQTMLFPGNTNLIDKSIKLPRYCGYVSMPERELQTFQVPYVSSPEKLKKLLQYKGSHRESVL